CRILFHSFAGPSEGAVPIGVLSDIAVVRQILENGTFHLEWVHTALSLEEYLAIHADQNRKGNTAAPLRPERFYGIGGVVGAPQQISVDGMLLFQKVEHELLL